MIRPAQRIAGLREAEQDRPSWCEEIFLLEAEPRAQIVEDTFLVDAGCHPAVEVRLADTKEPVGARAVRIDRHRLQHAIGAMPFGLLGRTAVKAPQRKLLKRRQPNRSL